MESQEDDINPYKLQLDFFQALRQDNEATFRLQLARLEEENIAIRWMDMIDYALKNNARTCLTYFLKRLDTEPDAQSGFRSPYYYQYAVCRAIANNDPSILHFMMYNIPCKTSFTSFLTQFHYMDFNEAMYAFFSHPALDKSLWDRLDKLHPNSKWNFYATRWRDRNLLLSLRYF